MYVLPAVYEHWSHGSSVVLFKLLMEGQKRCSIVRYSMIRPGSEVKLSHFQCGL